MGIEQDSIHWVSTILQGFSRTNEVGLSVEKPREGGLSDNLGTHVPREFTRAESLAKIRTALDAQVISNDYAQTPDQKRSWVYMPNLALAIREGASQDAFEVVIHEVPVE